MENVQHIRNERILFSPLNWGWGHVSRSIPLLQKLQEQNNEITLVCDADQKNVYATYLEHIDFLEWPGYPFQFRGKGYFFLDMLVGGLRLKRFARKERNFIKQLDEKANFTLILSDQRYFFRSSQVKSIFITHQLSLPLPFLIQWVQKINSSKINQFDEVWVVDNEDHFFAGKLSTLTFKSKISQHFIGPLSRFQSQKLNTKKKWTTVLISGPEPYAQQFYQEQKKRFDFSNEMTCIIYKGKCEDHTGSRLYTWKDIDQRLLETKLLVARSGYSTIMDVYFLGCEVEWHATPGQWEQIYLAKKLANQV